MRLIIINGPNLNLLGIREKEIYGDQSFEDFYKSLKEKYKNVSIEYYQSNHEGDLIEKIQLNRINTKVTLGGCFIAKINKTIL